MCTWKGRLFLFSLIFFSISGFAQETLVPLDSSGKIEVIDKELEQKLLLFTDYAHFREARLYQISDSSFVLEISYQPEDKTIKLRKALTLTEMSELRAKVSAQIAAVAPQALLNQSGRVKLIVGTTLMGVCFYGWDLPLAIDVDDNSAANTVYFFTVMASFFVPYIATQHSNVTDGAASFALYGETRGIIHGLLLGYALSSKEPSGEALSAATLVASVAEGIVFCSTANLTQMSDGKAVLIGTMGDFGLGLGAGASDLLGFYDGDDKDHAIATTMLLSTTAGMVVGGEMSNRENYTRGDAYVVRDAGILGTLFAIALTNLSDAKDKTGVSILMAGAVGGLASGNYLVKGKDFSTSDGALITLAELVGGLCGLGLSSAFNAHHDDYAAWSAVGATLGFGLTYSDAAKHYSTSNDKSSWNLNVVPEGIAELALHKTFSQTSTSPLLRLNIQF